MITEQVELGYLPAVVFGSQRRASTSQQRFRALMRYTSHRTYCVPPCDKTFTIHIVLRAFQSIYFTSRMPRRGLGTFAPLPVVVSWNILGEGERRGERSLRTKCGDQWRGRQTDTISQLHDLSLCQVCLICPERSGYDRRWDR